MKSKSRFLGIDDAPFRFSDEAVPVVGVVIQAPSYVEGVMTTLVDVDALHAKIDRPVVTVTRKKPDLAAIEAALRRRFDDWEERLELLRRHRVEAIRTTHGTLWVSYVGTDRSSVLEALSLTSVRGVLPEPLRIAHLIAAGIVRGESRGRA